VVVGGKWIYDRYKALQPSAALETIFVQGAADYYVINGYGEETLYRLLRAEMDGDRARAQSLPSLASGGATVPGAAAGPGVPGVLPHQPDMVARTEPRNR
jgi:hypothetical protein